MTTTDIAREAGVSYTTVSNIKPETRERVLTAMTRLGYGGSASA